MEAFTFVFIKQIATSKIIFPMQYETYKSTVITT